MPGGWDLAAADEPEIRRNMWRERSIDEVEFEGKAIAPWEKRGMRRGSYIAWRAANDYEEAEHYEASLRPNDGSFGLAVVLAVLGAGVVTLIIAGIYFVW